MVMIYFGVCTVTKSCLPRVLRLFASSKVCLTGAKVKATLRVVKSVILEPSRARIKNK